MKKFFDWLMGEPRDVDLLRNRVALLEQQVKFLMETQKPLEQPIERKHPAAPAPRTWRQTLATHEAYSQQREDLSGNGY